MLGVVDVLRQAVRPCSLAELEAKSEAGDTYWLRALDACVESGLLSCFPGPGESRYRLTRHGRRLLETSHRGVAAA